MAFLEFKKESIVKKIMRKNPEIKIQDRVLVMNFVGKANRPEDAETTDKKKAKGKRLFQKNEAKMSRWVFNLVFPFTAPASPKHTLFVSNLPYRVKEATLRTLFKKAVRVDLPELNGKRRG